jgi:hypothetical protein
MMPPSRSRSLALLACACIALEAARASAAESVSSDRDTVASAPVPGTPPRAHGFAAYSLTAFGLTGSGFSNQLLGARYEFAFTPRYSLGFGAAYANLKGKDGRASNVLAEVLFGYRLPLGRVVSIPFQFGGGYLPKNGPTLRAGTGFDFELGSHARLTLTLLEPMVWVTRNRPEASLNLGAAVVFRL